MIDYNEDWLFLLLFQRTFSGSVSLRACCFAIPASLVAFLLRRGLGDKASQDLRDDLQLEYSKSSALWACSTVIMFFVLGLRTNRAVSRFWEGTTLLHMMRGEWFDSTSCCVSYTHTTINEREDEVREFRNVIVRLMSLCHASALREIAGTMTSDDLISLDCAGLSSQTLRYLREMKDNYGFGWVELILHMIRTLIVVNHSNGVIGIEPPILTRVFQTLSRGFVNLLNAKKISDTRFPFPYAQMVSMMLFLHVLMTPVLMSWVIHSDIWVVVFTFVPLFALHSINYTAIELENPFGDRYNDLPLAKFQVDMNKCLLMLLEDHADIDARISPVRCLREFRTVLERYDTDLSGSCSQRRVSEFSQETASNGTPERATGVRASLVGMLSQVTGSRHIAFRFLGSQARQSNARNSHAADRQSRQSLWQSLDDNLETDFLSPSSSVSSTTYAFRIGREGGLVGRRPKPDYHASNASSSSECSPRDGQEPGSPKPTSSALAKVKAATALFVDQSSRRSSFVHWRPPPRLATRLSSKQSAARQPTSAQETPEALDEDWIIPWEPLVVESTVERPVKEANVLGGRSSSKGTAGLDRLENVVGGSVAAVQTTLERWTQSADDHSQAVRSNTEAINRLCEIIPSLTRGGARNIVTIRRIPNDTEGIYRLCDCEVQEHEIIAGL